MIIQPGLAIWDGGLGASETLPRRIRVREDGRSASGEGQEADIPVLAIDPHFQGYGNPFFSVQTASVKTGVRLGGRGRREAQPRPARGREAEVAGEEPRHRFAGRTENPPEIVILPPAAPPVSAGPSGYTENS